MHPFDTFDSDWRNDAAMASACAELYRYLDSSRLDHYSFAQLRGATSRIDDAKLASVLQYLSSPRCNILKQVFLFFDHADGLYEIPDADVVTYLAKGEFPHPETGQLIPDLNQIVVAYDLGPHFERTSA